MTGKTTPLYIICSSHRCVGKTLVSRLLTEFYVVNDRSVAAFDLADEGPQLADYLPELTTIADIGDTEGQMALFDRLLAKEGAKIIDLSHRAFEKFVTLAQAIRFFQEARHRFIEPLILFIIDPDPKSAKAYAMLRHQFSEASLLPVRNQIEKRATLYGDAPAQGNMVPASLDIPLLGFSLRALIDRQSFSFSEFWRAQPADLPAPLDDELWGWVERIFFQLLDIEAWLGCEQPSTRVRALRSKRPRTTHRPSQQDARPLGSDFRGDAESAAVNRGSIDVPEQVLEFAPRKDRRTDIDPIDQSGNAIVAMLRKAADLSNENCDRARTMAKELARQLQAAEDRISQLETEVQHFQNRAVRAETWLQQIQREIEEKLIAPMAAAGPKSTP
jgi:hypothetical protein